MKTVGAYEAKTHLPQLLEQVAQGEQITITKHGVPVALITAAREAPKVPLSETIAELMTFNRGRKLGELSIRQMIEEGRK